MHKTKKGAPEIEHNSIYIYIYMPTSQAKGRILPSDKLNKAFERDAKMSFADRKNVENVALPP